MPHHGPPRRNPAAGRGRDHSPLTSIAVGRDRTPLASNSIGAGRSGQAAQGPPCHGKAGGCSWSTGSSETDPRHLRMKLCSYPPRLFADDPGHGPGNRIVRHSPSSRVGFLGGKREPRSSIGQDRMPQRPQTTPSPSAAIASSGPHNRDRQAHQRQRRRDESQQQKAHCREHQDDHADHGSQGSQPLAEGSPAPGRYGGRLLGCGPVQAPGRRNSRQARGRERGGRGRRRSSRMRSCGCAALRAMSSIGDGNFPGAEHQDHHGQDDGPNGRY